MQFHQCFLSFPFFFFSFFSVVVYSASLKCNNKHSFSKLQLVLSYKYFYIYPVETVARNMQMKFSRHQASSFPLASRNSRKFAFKFNVVIFRSRRMTMAIYVTEFAVLLWKWKLFETQRCCFVGGLLLRSPHHRQRQRAR